jgi:hypothetical protein
MPEQMLGNTQPLDGKKGVNDSFLFIQVKLKLNTAI